MVIDPVLTIGNQWGVNKRVLETFCMESIPTLWKIRVKEWTSGGVSSCRRWREEKRRDGWVDSRGAAPDGRHVEETEHCEGKPRLPQVYLDQQRRAAASEWHAAGRGVALFTLRREMKWITRWKLLNYLRGDGGGGQWVPEGVSRLLQVITLSLTILWAKNLWPSSSGHTLQGLLGKPEDQYIVVDRQYKWDIPHESAISSAVNMTITIGSLFQ